MQTDAPINDWSFDTTGPQTDGTWNIPDAATAVIPTDAGGGPPANYSSGVLDFFKFGVGAWQQDQQQQRMIDYKRFEATNGGLYQQGQPAIFNRAAGGGISPNVLLAGGLIVAVVLMTRKG